MGKSIKLKGPGLNEWIAEGIVKEHGTAALERTSGPMREAVQRILDRQADRHSKEAHNE